MVDAAASGDAFAGAHDAAAAATPERSAPWAMVHGPGAAALDSYTALCRVAVASPAQSALWVRAWAQEAAPDYLVASLRIDGAAVFALPLEICREGRLTVARLMGGSHANSNFAPAAPSWLAGASMADLRALLQAIAKARPDLDLIVLERQAPTLAGHRNPLAQLSSRPSPNIALSLRLDGGFEAVQERSGGKRKRKKYRAQIRKFEAAGGWRRRTARTRADIEELLSAFFALKHQRFAAMGIPDPFAPPKVRNFFLDLFVSALDDSGLPFRLDGLEVGGKLRAITGSSAFNRTMTCEFGAIRDDELSHSSPGEFLFFHNIQEACETGFETYDFGVGDEAYKRAWCDIETVQFDTIVPLSLKGRMAAMVMVGAGRAKRFVKSNPVIWTVVKRLRRGLAAKAPAEES